MENNMSALANLKLIAAKKPTQLSPVAARRNKMVKRIAEQLELAKALQEGRVYAPTKLRNVKNDDGVTTAVSVAKRVKQWWWNADNGKLCISLRYGVKVISLNTKGATAVEVASNDELVATLDVLKDAIAAGELDAQIEAVAGALKAGFEK
jgi:hypothetical protein